MRKFIQNVLYPFTFKKRDQELKKLLLSNNFNTTSKEILSVEFGEEFLAQNGIKQLPQHPINLKPSYMDKDSGFLRQLFALFMTVGYVHRLRNNEKTDSDNTIYYNPLIHSSIGKIGLTSATIATIAFKPLVAVLSVFSGMFSSARGAYLAGFTKFSPTSSFADLIGHEHVHILQRESIYRSQHLMDYDVFENEMKDSISQNIGGLNATRIKIDTVASIGTSAYFRTDAEVQARIHTIVAHGSKRWGRLPQNRNEFYAAMDEAGIEIPNSLSEIKTNISIKNSCSNFQRKTNLVATFKRFARKHLNPEIAELNSATNAWLQKSAKEEFWKTSMPYLYGHWLELIGDPDGRKKMGYRTLKTLDDLNNLKEPVLNL